MIVVKHFRELRVYREAFESAMQIFDHTKKRPKEERYSLTDQIRRSSRSVCEQIAEAWRKRRYISHFRSKLTDLLQVVDETLISPATGAEFMTEAATPEGDEYV